MRALLLVLVLLAAAVGAGATWLLGSGAGLAWGVAQLERATDGAVTTAGARGTLAGGARFDRLRYASANLSVEAKNVALSVSPYSLLALTLRIPELRVDRLDVRRGAGGAADAREGAIGLPLRVAVGRAVIERLTLTAGGEPIEVSDVAFGYTGSASGHHVSEASLTVRGFTISGDAALGAARPHAVNATLAARRADGPPARLDVRLRGTLAALDVQAQLDAAGARARLTAALSALDQPRIERARIALESLDLRALDAGLPQTRLSGALQLAADAGKSGRLAGSLRLRNDAVGPYDGGRLPVATLDARVTTGLAHAQLEALAIGLGRGGRLAGRGTLERAGIELDLEAHALDLAALHGRLRRTALDGPLRARVERERQLLTARLTGHGTELAFTAERRGERLAVRELRARAGGGELTGQGEIALGDKQAFRAELAFERFDPSAWGDFPGGALAGRATATGALAPLAGTLEFRLLPSNLRSEALSGAGTVRFGERRLAVPGLDVSWGGNRLTAHGTLGTASDVLIVRIEAPRLAVLEDGLAGALSGAVRLRGTWPTPAIDFDLRGRALSRGETVRVGTASARGTYEARTGGALQLHATANEVRAHERLHFDRITVTAQGTRPAHTIEVSARGADFQLDARLRGAWPELARWSGTLETLTNRGRLPVALEAPAGIEVAPGHLVVGAARLDMNGGRLELHRLHYESGRLATAGAFSRLRVAPLLAFAGANPADGGTLEVAGDWSIEAAPRWSGAFHVRRESGDLLLGTDPELPFGLDALEATARLTDDAVAFAGRVRSALLTGRIDGTARLTGTPEAPRLARESPLAFEAEMEIARLAALAPAMRSTLRFDGRLRAALKGGGTVGAPHLSGRIEGDALSVSYPAEGVDLRRGILRAELAGTALHVRSFSIVGGEGLFSASGTLTANTAERSALAWKAERLGILRRPDRKLTVSGSGEASLAAGRLSLSGALRAEDGLIELREATLPAPGDDVVVAGRPRAGREDARLAATALDLSLDFGNQLRIRGRGLDTLLDGAIRVRTNAEGRLTANGTVRAVRGTYRAFGQQLDLERGRLVFDGPIENPTLDIRALRKIAEVSAGVEVAGTLREPFVRVVSDPPMPENDALSWLLLGHGPREAGAGDLAIIPAAAAALLGQRESPGDGLAQRFGVDSIGLRRGGELGQQFVTVGKRLSDELYVIYEQGLGATASVLRLELALTRRLLLRAEAGGVSGLGLFYRWAFD